MTKRTRAFSHFTSITTHKQYPASSFYSTYPASPHRCKFEQDPITVNRTLLAIGLERVSLLTVVSLFTFLLDKVYYNEAKKTQNDFVIT